MNAPHIHSSVQDQRQPSQLRRGYLDGLSAYLIWGLFPLYWPLLKPAGAVEILAHRIFFSFVFVQLLVWRGRHWPRIRSVLSTRRTRRLILTAAVLVTVNWGVYIWAVNAGHVIEASLGYFINPLLSIVAGVLIFGERLRRAQWVAVTIATSAIVVLTVDYGHPPWIALTLAVSFAGYGLCKKSASVGAVESLAIESGVMVLPASAVLIWMQGHGSLVFAHHGVGNTLLLMGSGVVTAIPLLFFGAAARTLPLSALGMIQYLTPVLQFLVGVTVAHESMPAARWIGFALVWVALVVISADALHTSRSASSQQGDTPKNSLLRGHTSSASDWA